MMSKMVNSGRKHINTPYTLKRIKDLLERKQMTQKQLAEKSGISTSTISKILKGDTNMGEDHIKAIAKAFDTVPQELLDLPEGYVDLKDADGNWVGMVKTDGLIKN